MSHLTAIVGDIMMPPSFRILELQLHLTRSLLIVHVLIWSRLLQALQEMLFLIRSINMMRAVPAAIMTIIEARISSVLFILIQIGRQVSNMERRSDLEAAIMN